MMHYGIFDNIAKVAKAHALVIEANVAKAVFVPHFHTVIAAGPLGDDLAPDVQLCQQLFAGGINCRNAQRRRRIGGQRSRLCFLQHCDAQAATL